MGRKNGGVKDSFFCCFSLHNYFSAKKRKKMRSFQGNFPYTSLFCIIFQANKFSFSTKLEIIRHITLPQHREIIARIIFYFLWLLDEHKWKSVYCIYEGFLTLLTYGDDQKWCHYEIYYKIMNAIKNIEISDFEPFKIIKIQNQRPSFQSTNWTLNVKQIFYCFSFRFSFWLINESI